MNNTGNIPVVLSPFWKNPDSTKKEARLNGPATAEDQGVILKYNMHNVASPPFTRSSVYHRDPSLLP